MKLVDFYFKGLSLFRNETDLPDNTSSYLHFKQEEPEQQVPYFSEIYATNFFDDLADLLLYESEPTELYDWMCEKNLYG